MRPFRLGPIFKGYIWGGRRLIDEWGKTPEGDSLAESWELTAHKDGDNLILDGELSGLTLSEAVKRHPEIVSPDFDPKDTFPLMVKLIDAARPLSVQVHPDDKRSAMLEHEKGKTECWHILGHEEGAYIYLGFTRPVSESELREAISSSTLTDLLKKVYVNDGDTYFIPAGTVHAIGAGVTLAEIQENSNVTYRLYDYGRGRELHIDKGLSVAARVPALIEAPGRSVEVIVSCDKFTVRKVKAPYTGKADDGFMFGLCVSGECEFSCGGVSFKLKKGGNVYVPSNCKDDFVIEGECEFLITRQ